MTMKKQQVARRHSDTNCITHIMVNNLDIKRIRILAIVWYDLMNRLLVRPRQYPQRTIVLRRFGDRKPETDLWRPVEVEIEFILMPGLTQRTWVLEDKLGQKAVVVFAKQSLKVGL